MDAFVGNQVAAGADVRMGVFGERRKCRGWPGGDWEPFSRPVVPVGAISDRTDAAAEVVVPTLLSKTAAKLDTVTFVRCSRRLLLLRPCKRSGREYLRKNTLPLFQGKDTG
eukprot:1140310-Pelagomonas_calceolata.AAC.3